MEGVVMEEKKWSDQDSVEEQQVRERFREKIREIKEKGPLWYAAKEDLERQERERTPEYLEQCRVFNRIAKEIMEETGEVIPLIELDEE